MRHHKCIGWTRAGFDFCGCARGLCRRRLLTGVMRDVTEPPDEGES